MSNRRTIDRTSGYDLYKHYRDKGIDMIDSASERHSKVMQTMMDFRYPQDMQSDGTNRDFTNTMRSLTRELRQEGYDPAYLARREQKNQPNQHYHLNLLTNAKKNECRQAIIEKAEKHWANALGLSQDEVHENKLVYPCNHDQDGNPRPNGYMLNRNADNYDETKGKMIQQMSYLTKFDPDDTTPSSTRKFFASQYRKDEQNNCHE